MNKRQLKKSIRFTCAEIASECAFTSALMENVNNELLAEAFVEAARLQGNALKKASVSFDRLPKDFPSKAAYNKARKAYYKKAYAALTSEFNNELAAIIGKMNAAVKPAE